MHKKNIDASFDIENAVAIIGMACRFPGANNVDEFWRNLYDGVESIRKLTDEELMSSGVPCEYLTNPAYVKAASIIDEPDFFDAAFFGFSPMEARMTDPQHRILLELSYQALEHSGYNSEHYDGRISIFTGSALNTYFMNQAISGKFLKEYLPTLIGNDKDFVSTRISYKLNLKGPSINVQTACSTSLVAVHLACQSILSGESDMALAGAISVKVPHKAGYFHYGGGVASPDGHVRAFDVGANGTVFGSGGGVIVLKRLEDAVRDGDTVMAVIRGSAVNNDGGNKAGYTAPSFDSLADVVVEALANADMDARDISYIEAHGAGTPIGDSIEVNALTKAFRCFTNDTGYCAIGSVKTNVGHLDVAAGIAGIIKTVLSLYHGKIPASINYSRPNPEIDFENSPFYVNDMLRTWNGSNIRRAGVMATGIGGTNAFVVFEESPKTEKTIQLDVPKLLVLSAKTEASLKSISKELQEHFERNFDINFDNAAYTLQNGRRDFKYRRFLVSENLKEAAAFLKEENPEHVFDSILKDNEHKPVVFLFPDIDDFYIGMARDLYAHFNIFREEMDLCCDSIKLLVNVDAREILYHKAEQFQQKDFNPGISSEYTYAIQFSVEYALARLWRHFGIEPEAVIGCGIGEYAAAYSAGIFSLEDALRLVAAKIKAEWEIKANGRPEVNKINEVLKKVKFNEPKFKFASNESGTWIKTENAMDPSYWAKRIISTVSISNAGYSIPEYKAGILLEMGCGRAIEIIKHSGLQNNKEVLCLATLRQANENRNDVGALLQIAGEMWNAGCEIKWNNLDQREHKKRIPLPGYVFEKKLYWLR